MMENEIQIEFDRHLKNISHIEPRHREVPTLSANEVLRAHFLIANYFYQEGHGLGGLGPIDYNIFISTIDRQFVSFGNQFKWSNIFDVCSTLFFGLVKNHAFYDANKRTAFLCTLFLMQKNGWCPAIHEKEFEDFTVEIADNQLSKYSRYNDLRKTQEDPEVRYISWYMRKNFRKIDQNNYPITFRELKQILNRFGFDLSNPSGNYIDVIKIEQKRRFFGGDRTVVHRICQIGFPRWSEQVGKAAIKTVRQETGLTYLNGIDSAAFYKSLDPIQSLITTYNAPLNSLANR